MLTLDDLEFCSRRLKFGTVWGRQGVHAAGNYVSLTLRLKPGSESGTAAAPHPAIPACSKIEFSLAMACVSVQGCI